MLGYGAIGQYAVGDGPDPRRDLVALDLVLDAPVLATPVLTQTHVLSAHLSTDIDGIVLSPPVLPTPVLVPSILILSAQISTDINGIWLSPPVLATPTLGQNHHFSTRHPVTTDTYDDGFTLAAPVLGTPLLGQNHRLEANPFDLTAPVLARPILRQNHHLTTVVPVSTDVTTDGITLEPPVLGTPNVTIIGHYLIPLDVILEHPHLHLPRLTVRSVLADQPTFVFPSLVLTEPAEILRRMLAGLLSTIRVSTGRTGSDLRRLVGDLDANAEEIIRSGELSAPLFECFEAARLADATLLRMGMLRESILDEVPVSLKSVAVVQLGIRLCLIEEAKILAATAFVSREDVEAVLARMNAAFVEAEEVAADQDDTSSYRALVAMHAAVTQHLVESARPLPRVVNYEFPMSLPTLRLAQRLYADGSRADELLAENKTIHPAFAPRQGRALAT